MARDSRSVRASGGSPVSRARGSHLFLIASELISVTLNDFPFVHRKRSSKKNLRVIVDMPAEF